MGLGEAIDNLRALLVGDQVVEESRGGSAMTTDEVLEFITTEAEPHIRSQREAAKGAGAAAG